MQRQGRLRGDPMSYITMLRSLRRHAMFDAVRRPWRDVKTRVRQLMGTELRYRVEFRVPKLTLGDVGAEWTVATDCLHTGSIVYSVGIGTDISFDNALIDQFGLEVHAFDPTPRSREWLQMQDLSPRFRFHPWGLADRDGTASFVAPASEKHVSYSIADSPASGTSVELPVFRLKTIMKRLDHDHVDVLKIDIEGAELDVIPDILSSGVRVRQLLAEFHHRGDRQLMQRTERTVQLLAKHGFRIFDVSPSAQEVSWIGPS